jgi:ribosome-associated protein
MIQITETLFIDENDIQLDFMRSSGPGGQNVNKVATAVLCINRPACLPKFEIA